MNLQRIDYGSSSSSSRWVRLIFSVCFRKFLELKDPISGNHDALNSHIRATWSTWRCDILPDCTRLAICWVIAGSTVARVPLNSPERSLTNSVCAGEDSGKEGRLGVVLELAAAFVDSLMMKVKLKFSDPSRQRHARTCLASIFSPNISSLILAFKL